MAALDRKHALTVMTRLASRRPDQRAALAQIIRRQAAELAPLALEVAIETGDPIGSVLADALRDLPFDDEMGNLERRIPFETTALRELALLCVRKRFEANVYQQELSSPEQAVDAACILTEYAARLSAVGNVSASRDSLVEAIRLLQVVDDPSGRLDPIYAEVWNNLAVSLADRGSHEDAKDAAELAVEHHQACFDTGREDAVPLADSISTLATALFELGNWLQARQHLERALEVLDADSKEARPLAGDRPRSTPRAVRLIRARVSNNLGLALQELGETHAAIDASCDAIREARRVAEADPDHARPYLARYLIGSVPALSAAGRIDDAREALAEGMAIWTELNAARPDAFANDYLTGLARRDAFEREFGKEAGGEDAAADEEAEALERVSTDPARLRRWWHRFVATRVAQTNGDWKATAEHSGRAIQGLARSSPGTAEDAAREAKLLLLHGVAQRKSGNAGEAVAAGEKALAMLKPIDEPIAVSARAEALVIHAGFLLDLPDADAKVAATVKQAILAYGAIGSPTKAADAALLGFDGLFERRPELAQELLGDAEHAGTSDPSTSLKVKARRCFLAVSATRGRGRHSLAPALELAASCLAGVAESEPGDDHLRHEIGHWLGMAAHHARDWGHADAGLFYERAIAAYGDNAHLGDADLLRELFTLRFASARLSTKLGEHQAAMSAYEEAVRLHEERSRRFPEEAPSGLAVSWDALSRAQAALGLKDEALASGRKSVAAFERAYELAPEQAAGDYAVCLNNLSNRLWAAGHRREAFESNKKCMAIIRALPSAHDELIETLKANTNGSIVERGLELGEDPSELMAMLTMIDKRQRADI